MSDDQCAVDDLVEKEKRWSSKFSKGDRVRNSYGETGAVLHYAGNGSYWIDYDKPKIGALCLCDFGAMERI